MLFQISLFSTQKTQKMNVSFPLRCDCLKTSLMSCQLQDTHYSLCERNHLQKHCGVVQYYAGDSTVYKQL